MGRLVGLAIWLIAIITVGLFLSGHWWFPEAVSQHGGDIDRQFNLTIWVVGISFFAAQIALGYVVWRFRASGNERAVYSHGNNRLEIIWTLITAAVFVTVAFMGQKVWAQLHLNDAPPDAVQIEATGQQFQWYFRYPGPDGKFGRNDPKLYNEEDNSPTARPGPIGIDPKDPDGKDDIVSLSLAVPVNRPVRITLRAKDVTHSFFVPQLRFKQDAVPGMKINIHFTPVKIGTYEVACAELCGLGHYKMRATFNVMSQADFEKWLKEKAEQ